MKHWYLIPLAALGGLVAGAWGPRADLAELKDMRREQSAKSETNAKSGFGAIANLANIPDRAKSGRLQARVETNRVENAAETNRVENAAETNRLDRPRPPRPAWRNREDLKNRIEDAKELWRTRTELARTQWKAKLGLDEESAQRFDRTLDDMNADLTDLMREFAAEVAEAKEVSPELGVKMMSAVTAVLAEGYDAVGECVDEERRGEVSKLALHEFIDPSAFEPMIQVQDYLEAPQFTPGPGPQ